ncbi:MAG TPA: AMP-binding protein [Burkholderiales bacterium]|jgi:acyl-coenzyme A synthetase/AMP-(fatty) acid ligase
MSARPQISTLPLIAGFGPDAVFAWRAGGAVSVRSFLAEVARVAAQLPARGQVINLCADRYRFAVGFAAALLRGQVSMLPPNHTPEMVAQLKREYPELYCLREADGAALEVDTVLYPQGEADERDDLPVPSIPAEQVAAYVFTSGSTGTPLPNRKTWGRLVLSAQGEAARLDLGATPGRAPYSLVGTVPPQHMYGFESTVLLPMQGGLAMHAGRPFYAADVAAALGSLPRPRALITTPVHLRALVEETGTLPPPDFLLCATAPLSDELARTAEARLQAPLYEIYGCTEAGQVASRRSTAGPQWQTLPGLVLRNDERGTWVSGGHVDGEILLGDVIELAAGQASGSATHFELRGRNADMINIAGKRTSLAHLNFHLTAIEGVRDGVFVLPESGDGHPEPRLAAIAVAPGMSTAQITRALRRRIDAVFLPRPFYLVESLPRNTTGKLTAAAVRELLAQCASKERQP